jgi:ubiquitin-conjugating enzyme E2 J1
VVQAVQDDMPPGIIDMHYSDTNMHDLLFAIAGPEKTNFEGGVYVLKLLLPSDYPYSPPDFIMCTPNGRFAVGKKICTSFSGFHPETWSPAYTLTTLLLSFISFLSDEHAPAMGAIYEPAHVRKQMAAESVAFAQKSSFAKQMRVFALLNAGLQTASSLKDATELLMGGRPDEKAQAGTSAHVTSGQRQRGDTDIVTVLGDSVHSLPQGDTQGRTPGAAGHVKPPVEVKSGNAIDLTSCGGGVPVGVSSKRSLPPQHNSQSTALRKAPKAATAVVDLT